jgi:hypothetical protein
VDGTSLAGPSPSSVRTTMPWNAFESLESTEWMSGCASNQTTAVRLPEASLPSACPMAPSSTLQSPPMVIAGPSIVDRVCVSRSRTSSIELARCTPVPCSSPASSGTSTTRVLADGRSPRMASAPSTSLIALVELEPCHCGTTTNVTATRPVWP